MVKLWLALFAGSTHAALVPDSDSAYLSVEKPSGSVDAHAEQTRQPLQPTEELHGVQQPRAFVSELLRSSSGSKESNETTADQMASVSNEHLVNSTAQAKTVRRSSASKASRRPLKMWVSSEGETHPLHEPVEHRPKLEGALHSGLHRQHSNMHQPLSKIDGDDKVPLPQAILTAMSSLTLVRVREMITGSDNYIMVNLMIAVLCCLVCCPLFLRIYFLLPLSRAEPISVEEALEPTSSLASGGSKGSHRSRRTSSRSSRSHGSGGGSRAGGGIARAAGSDVPMAKALTPRGRRGREPPETNRPEPQFIGDPRRPPSTPPTQMTHYNDERPSSTDHGSEAVSGRAAAASAASTQRTATRSRGATPGRGATPASRKGTPSRGTTPSTPKTRRTEA